MDKKILIGGGVLLLIIGGVIGMGMLRPEKPTVEQANVILTESIQNTLGLNSFAAISDGVFEVKDDETILFKVELEDMQTSIINPFDFAEQDSSFVFTYNVLMNFEAIIDFIEKTKTPEELDELRAGGEMMGMDMLAIMRALGEANISATMEMKSIDFDSYIKIVEIVGLREIVTDVAGVFAAEMVMGGIEPYLGVWQKTPSDPVMEEEMTAMFEGIEGLVSAAFDAYYVREVLPNTKVNEVSVYNFVLGVNLDEVKEVVISFIPLFAEKAEIDAKEKEKIITGIKENWPEIVKVIEAMETDSRIYICQETRFTIKETGSVNMNLYELVAVLEPIMQEIETEVTPEEEAELARMKETVKNMNIVTTINVVYSDHNAVPAILPPAEYEVIETPKPAPMPTIPMPDFYEPFDHDFPMPEFPAPEFQIPPGFPM